MKKATLILLALGLLCVTAKAWADDDVDCGDRVKTCFMDGAATSCICVDPAENRDDPAVQPPPAGEDPGPYEVNPAA